MESVFEARVDTPIKLYLSSPDSIASTKELPPLERSSEVKARNLDGIGELVCFGGEVVTKSRFVPPTPLISILFLSLSIIGPLSFRL